MFTLDGTKAVVQSSGQAYELTLSSVAEMGDAGDDEPDSANLTFDRVPHIKGKQVQCFTRGPSTVLFCQKTFDQMIQIRAL